MNNTFEKKIESFVDDVLRFKSFVELTPRVLSGNTDTDSQLSASAPIPIYSGKKRVSVAVDKEETILCRVFKNELNNSWDLYFASAESKPIEFSVLHTSGSNKCYIIDKNRYAEIPFADDINPEINPMRISFPFDKFKMNCKETDHKFETANGWFTLQYLEDSVEFCYNSFSAYQPTKLIIINKNDTGLSELFSIHNGKALLTGLQKDNQYSIVSLY